MMAQLRAADLGQLHESGPDAPVGAGPRPGQPNGCRRGDAIWHCRTQPASVPADEFIQAPATAPTDRQVIHYNDSKIQLLDLPGIIEGAAEGKGRGRQVRHELRRRKLARRDAGPNLQLRVGLLGAPLVAAALVHVARPAHSNGQPASDRLRPSPTAAT